MTSKHQPEYKQGPDWVPGPYGMRFKPRIERALSAFMARLTPAMLARIGHVDAGRTNPWTKLIAKLLWERLAPENGVAFPEVYVLTLENWPTKANKVKTHKGEELWVEYRPARHNHIRYQVLVMGDKAPIVKSEIQTPVDTPVILYGSAAEPYPTLYHPYGLFPPSLKSWVSLLEIIHLFGEKLRGKGPKDKICSGFWPLSAEIPDDVIHQIRTDLEGKQVGRSPVFFMGAASLPPFPHKSLSELVEGLIGWEIAALAAASIRGEIELKDAKKGDFVTVSYAGETVTGKVVQVKKDGTVTVDLTGRHPDEDVGYVDFSTKPAEKAFDNYVARGWPAPKGTAEQTVRGMLIARVDKPAQLTKYRLEEAFEDDPRLWQSSISYLRRLEPEIGKAAVGKLLEHVQSILREL